MSSSSPTVKGVFQVWGNGLEFRMSVRERRSLTDVRNSEFDVCPKVEMRPTENQRSGEKDKRQLAGCRANSTLATYNLPLAVFLCLLALPFLCGFGPPRLVDDSHDPHYRLSTVQLRQWGEVAQLPDISAEAAIVYDMDTNQLLLTRNPDQRLAPASLTKLMTALLVLESGDTQRLITIEQDDLVGDSNMGLEAGEVISVEQLLYGLLINSANDAAMALARTVSGSLDPFVGRMNQRAEELDLRNTHFLNPHGLDMDGHFSSARDLLALTHALWDYPLFRTIVGTQDTTVAGHRLHNTNELLGSKLLVNGVKTGTTDEAGECLIVGVVSNGHQRFIVVLNSQDRYADTRRLIELADQYFPWQASDPQQLSILNRQVEGESFQFYRPKGDPPVLMLSPLNRNSLIGQRSLFPELLENGAAGKIEWLLAGTKVAETPLFGYDTTPTPAPP